MLAGKGSRDVLVRMVAVKQRQEIAMDPPAQQCVEGFGKPEALVRLRSDDILNAVPATGTSTRPESAAMIFFNIPRPVFLRVAISLDLFFPQACRS